MITNEQKLALESRIKELDQAVCDLGESWAKQHVQLIEATAKCAETKAERDALAITVQQMREALEFCNETVKDLHLDQGDGEVHYPMVEDALALPDTSEIIKRHDAAVLRKAADTTLSEQSVLLDGMHGYTALKIQGLMIESLHLKADELEKS